MRKVLLSACMIVGLAWPAIAQQYSTRDISSIVDASQHNEMRFNRDYKDKSFVGVLRFRSVDSSYSWLAGGYMVEFYGAFCSVDEAQAKSMIDVRTGQPVSVSAVIANTTLGSVMLTHCHVTLQ